jgi:multidrug efflux pump subunit AcrA (membrane-fusion protein)
MKVFGVSRGIGICLIWTGLASGQTLPVSAKIEAVPLELTMPERYQTAPVLEPVRRVTLVAPKDGLVRSFSVQLGATVREAQEVAQLDRSEAAARLKVALAEVKEKQALVKRQARDEVAQAQLEGAQARAELAQLELDRCTLHAPFAGRVMEIPVCSGQYVLKGTTILEIADVSSLKALHPVNRRSVKAGSALKVEVEDQEVAGKVQSILPLPDSFLMLRELVTPFAAAWVVLSNAKGELEPGLRLRSSFVPSRPIATVPKRAMKQESARGAEETIVQVLRNEYVTNVPVQVLGDIGPERVQISGGFRPADALIVGSSVPLLPGTLVRLGDPRAPRGIEGTAPSPNLGGIESGIISPGASRGRAAGADSGATHSIGSQRRQGSTPNPPASPSGDRNAPF